MGQPKKIDVGGGYAVQFLQRARGEESAYWVGRIFRDGEPVGSFHNEGRGGMTFVQPAPVAEAFRALVVEAAPAEAARVVHELENLVLVFAETRGYVRGGAAITLADVVRMFDAELSSFGKERAS